MSIEKFAITGTKDTDLISTCEFLLSQIGTIKAVETDAKKHMLVFHSYGDKGNAFPINVTATVLAEAVRQFIADTPASVFEEMLSGYEESYEYAWELFSPDWYSDEHGITDYSLSAVLACRPTIVEYGK
ncbi:hypothetical protein [Alistipes putredinis]|uniref:hypothetical protein n=1 Tax=Alistipes putredinis TaxID=28117 RepID=UPI003AB287D5